MFENLGLLLRLNMKISADMKQLFVNYQLIKLQELICEEHTLDLTTRPGCECHLCQCHTCVMDTMDTQHLTPGLSITPAIIKVKFID